MRFPLAMTFLQQVAFFSPRSVVFLKHPLPFFLQFKVDDPDARMFQFRNKSTSGETRLEIDLADNLFDVTGFPVQIGKNDNLLLIERQICAVPDVDR